MKKFIIYSLVTVVVIIGLYISYYYNDSRISVVLDSCVDGDTVWLKINGKKEKVRLLGIDAPEVAKEGVLGEEYGEDAKNYLCNSLEKSKSISIEYDINSDKRDKYDRVLVWLFVDDINMNKLLISKGYASVKYVYNNYKYIYDLCLEQGNAYKKKVGIWGKDKSYKDNYCIKNRIIDE